MKEKISELFIPFWFFVLAYEVTKILRNSLFTFLLFFIFLNFRLAFLALQNAKNGTHGNENLATYFWYFGSFDEKRTYRNM